MSDVPLDAIREHRDDYPLSDAIRDARREGEDNVQSWSSGRNVRDELDYAVARADALEARVDQLTAENERLKDFAFGDAPEWEKANTSLKHELRSAEARGVQQQEEIARLRAALEEIRATEGKVCDHYETCAHRACSSSYAAWSIADAVLDADRKEGGK